MATLLVFETEKEMHELCASFSHNWGSQKKIFGFEEEKVLKLAQQLFRASLNHESEAEIYKLKNKLFGIAKSHGLNIRWWGESEVCEPDRFLIYKNTVKTGPVAFIQC